MSSSRLFSLVAPTYNESSNIVEFLEGVHSALQPRGNFEVVVVDDNSPDLTWKIVSDYAERHPWARVCRRLNERGLSSAVLKGFEVARGSLLGVMDADLSHDEKVLPSMIASLEAGNDLCVGSRRIPGGGAQQWPWYRRIISHTASLISKVLLQTKLSDPMSGFFALDRALYESCKSLLAPQGYKVLLEIYCKGAPARVSEVPFVFKNRVHGSSKLTGNVIRQYLQMVVALRKNRRPHEQDNA